MAEAPARKVTGGRRNRVLRQAARSLSHVLVVTGALLAVEVAVTLIWQEPITALYASINQSGLEDDLTQIEEEGRPSFRLPAALDQVAAIHNGDPPPSVRRKLAALARELERKTAVGGALGRLEVDAIGSDHVMVQGATRPALEKGPGHYATTALPGERGTVAVAGHRTTYLAPFRYLDRLERGDDIVLDMPYAEFTYAVTKSRVVAPDAVHVLEGGDDRVVLTACHPLYSDAERIVVFGRLERIEPRNVTKLL